MPQVFVSIGSNIERERNIRTALAALQARFGPLAQSPVYESAPVGFAGENFFNLVVAFATAAPVDEVAAALREIEAACGRERSDRRFGPRTLDLDLLLYGELVRHAGGIDVPRPEIARYAFVLRPLAELAPELRHPETGSTFREMWARFDRAGENLRPVDLAAC